jgi:hypothetical protein
LRFSIVKTIKISLLGTELLGATKSEGGSVTIGASCDLALHNNHTNPEHPTNLLSTDILDYHRQEVEKTIDLA